MLNLFQRFAAIALCIVGGAAAGLSILASTTSPVLPTDMPAFIRMKLSFPVVRPDDAWSIVAGGDIMLSRFVAAMIEREGSSDFLYDDIRGLIQSADIAFANLENPVGPGARMPTEGLRFRANPETLDALVRAGFDIVSLANNHQSDIGQAYIPQTIDLVKKSGLQQVGAGITEGEARAPVLFTINGNNVAFLAYGDPRFSNQVHFATDEKPGIALANAQNMTADIHAAKEFADVIIVSLHSGIEYRETPDTYQLAFAQAGAEAGADIVLGHHPHEIQPLTQSGESWIIYSLGNLIFDQLWSEETRRGMLLSFLFEGNDISQIEATAIRTQENTKPMLSTGRTFTESVARLQTTTTPATVIRYAGEIDITILERALPKAKIHEQFLRTERTLHDNLNGNRLGEEYALRNGRLTIIEDGFPIWESPSEWWIDDIAIADTDGDLQKELMMSAWRSGDYGSSKPFWEEENDPAIRQHLFVYHFRNGRPQPVWQSSNLPRPNCEVAFADLDMDGVEELIVIEGEYTSDLSCTGTTVAIWKWNQWGFFNEWRSEPGEYWFLRTEKGDAGATVVVNGSAD